MAKMKIDELNTLSTSNDSEAFDYEDFIDHYFDTMQISEKQKKERIETAKELMDTILYFLIWCDEFPEQINDDVIRRFENDYKEKIFEFSEPDEYLASYVPIFIKNLLDVTMEHKDDEYFTSVERAATVAVNESNTVLNYSDLEKAKSLGYKNKTWVAEIDDRTRKDHYEMNGWTIPIDEWFVFEDCMGRFPHDEVNLTPQQLVNCRCSLRFS